MGETERTGIASMLNYSLVCRLLSSVIFLIDLGPERKSEGRILWSGKA